MKNMIKKSLSKKFIIKGVATILVVLLPFSFIKPKKVDAVVGVDDAILFTILGLGAVTSVGAVYGMSKSGIFEKVSSTLSDDLQSIGNGWKNIENNIAFAKSTVEMLPNILQAFESLEGSTYEEPQEPTLEGYKVPINYISDGIVLLTTIKVETGGTLNIPLYNSDGTNTRQVVGIVKTCENINLVIRKSDSYNDVYCSRTTEYGDDTLFTSPTLIEGFSGYLLIPKNAILSSYTSVAMPNLNDVQNEPTSISLDKSFVDSVATTYAEQNPNDNNGDKNVDYSTLIPLFFDMLEKKLGDGTITPTNLANNGVSSYVYKDGNVQGQNPYNFQNLGDNNLTVNNNINVNNGSEVSEEEKNGILNILDNGVRKTTTLLNNLKSSMTNLGNTLTGLFNFLPEPVGYLFYSALCLSLVFFILSLRR